MTVAPSSSTSNKENRPPLPPKKDVVVFKRRTIRFANRGLNYMTNQSSYVQSPEDYSTVSVYVHINTKVSIFFLQLL